MGFWTSVITGIAANFATKLLEAAGSRIRRRFGDSGCKKALDEALGSALSAAVKNLDLDESQKDVVQKIFEDWIFRPPVLNQFGKLLNPVPELLMDLDLMEEEFEDSGVNLAVFGEERFKKLIRDIAGEFYGAVAKVPVLQEPLKIDLLREMVIGMGALVEVQEKSLDVQEQIRDLVENIRDGSDQKGELIKLMLSELKSSSANQQAIYQSFMDALDRVGLLDGETRALDARRTEDLCQILKLLDKIHEKLTSPETGPSDEELASMEENYRQSIVDWFEILTFKGISPSGKPIALPLEKVYVELKAVADVPEEADTYSADERRLLLEAEETGERARDEMSMHLDSMRLARWKSEARLDMDRLQRQSINEILANPSRKGLVILGDPGSGKTTLLHYAALDMAQKGPESHLPIFLPLAAYDDHLRRTEKDMPLGDFLAVYYENWRNLPGLGLLFDQALEKGRAVLFLDGLDEVLETARRQFVAEQADALIRKWTGRGVRCVVTSRVVGYREAPLSSRLPHVTVLDFGRAEIETFARQWCLAYEIWAAGRETPAARQRASSEEKALLDDVRSNPSVERLAANPLMLTMLAILRRQVGKLPDRRVELYERYVRTLVDNWETVRSAGARQQGPARFDPHRAIAHLIDLAMWLQQNRPSGTASRKDIEGVLQNICLQYDSECVDVSGASEKARVSAKKQAECFLEDMRHFAGMLAERGRNAFGFMHLTFQEYFAGRALARMDAEERWNIIAPNLHNPRWREPILLCAGQLGIIEQRREKVIELARSILEAGSDHEDILHRDLFLGTAVMADDVGLSAGIFQTITERLELLLQSRILTLLKNAASGLAQLARIGHTPALNILLRSFKEGKIRNVVIEMAKPAIGADSCACLRTAILSYLKDNGFKDRHPAVNLLGKMAVHDKDVRNSMLALLDDRDILVRKAAVVALSGLVANDKEVRNAVLARLEGADAPLRHEAALSLSGLVANDKEVRNAVLALIGDRVAHVRVAAASALSGLVAHDETYQSAMHTLLKDCYYDVRCAAVDALSGLVAQDYDTRNAVIALIEDRVVSVRVRVVRAIARLVSQDEKIRKTVLALLKDRDFELRCAAVGALSDSVAQDDEARNGVLSLLDDRIADVRVAAVGAMRGLVAGNLEVRKAVFALLDDYNSKVRTAAANVVSGLVAHDLYARNVVFARLEDLHYDCRNAVIGALSRIVPNDEEARKKVLTLLYDSVVNVRVAAVRALSDLAVQDKEVRKAVLALLGDRHQNVRRASVVALSGLVAHDEEIRNAILVRLGDPDFHVCISAIRALSSLVANDKEARKAVFARLDDSNYYVCAAAVGALADLTAHDEEVRNVVLARLEDPYPDVRKAAIYSLRDLVDHDVEVRNAVFELLDDPVDHWVRIAAIEALSGVVASDKQVQNAIAKSLEDCDGYIRSAAVGALPSVAVHDKEARKVVFRFLGDPNYYVRAAAVRVLSSFVVHDKEARLAVVGCLEDSSWLVRKSAVLALSGLIFDDAAIRERLFPWLGMVSEFRRKTLADESRKCLAEAFSLVIIDDSDLFNRLQKMLDSAAWPERCSAVQAFCAMPGGPPKHLLPKIRAMLEDLRGEESWPNRLQIAALFINDRDPEVSRRAVDVAIEALEYATPPWYDLPAIGPQVRKQAAEILGNLDPLYRDDAIFERLVSVVNEDEHAGVRDSAFGALLRLAAAPEKIEKTEISA